LLIQPVIAQKNDSSLPEKISLLEKNETFEILDLTNPVSLQFSPVFLQSEAITVSDFQLVRNIDYKINYNQGTVTFLNQRLVHQKVHVRYQSFPFAIKKVYKRNLFPQQDKVQALDPTQGAKNEEPILDGDEQPTLQVAGSQTFGISVGSGRSLTQNQELRISVNGEVSENVSVIAMLSDQDLPIQPEGTTENIRDIDQKLIKITSPNVNATFGDFVGSLDDSDVQFPMALEGVSVEGNFGWGTFRLIPSAIPKGQSDSKTIRGEEGRSEYRIDVEGQYVVVKAGSEIVWLNGKRMRRGENNDYFIRDYGDPIIEFTSKHLITSNDVIRVDFEYIQEDLIYQRTLQSVSGSLDFLGNKAKLGFSYAVESDLNDPENTYAMLTEQDMVNLRQNILDVGKNQRSLIAPQRHTVWGIEAQVSPVDYVLIRGKFALSATDENTFSQTDRKVLGKSWELVGNASTEKLDVNLDLRLTDLGFVPVGASSKNRDQFQYEELYADQQFDNQYLMDTTTVPIGEERLVDIDVQFQPLKWIQLNSGIGRTRSIDSSAISNESFHVEQDTAFINYGFSLNPLKLPNLRNNTQVNTSGIGSQRQFRKERNQWNLSQRVRGSTLNGSIEQFEAVDLDPSDSLNLNRKRRISKAFINLAEFKWATVNAQYGWEESHEKDELLEIDGETLGFTDWKSNTRAKTWTIGVFSQPRKWANLSSNISRREFKTTRGRLPDSTTQLADIEMRMSPLNRAIDLQINYELDKKLATERREIYTNINPYNGREIHPGEGHYVKIDDLHYREDYEKGSYIKYIQNVSDKPVSAIDAKIQIRLRPRQWKATRDQQLNFGRRFLKAINGFARVNLTEEQEDADLVSLYLLQSLQTARTIFGRMNRRLQVGLSPSPKLNVDLGRTTNQTLNKRINNRERKRNSSDWDLRCTLNPTMRLSVNTRLERRKEHEKFSEIGGLGDISDLNQAERNSEINLRYEINRSIRVGLTGIYQNTIDFEELDDQPETRTRTISMENHLSYSIINRGRIDINYRLANGKSEGGIPFARYNFYEGVSHEIRATADYKVHKFTDLLLRLNYRLLSTKQQKPEHRLEMEMVAEL